MGRRIPRKNKGNKIKSVDPFSRSNLRSEKLASGINRAPKNLDQEVPRSFRNIFGSNDDKKRAAKSKKRKNGKRQDNEKGNKTKKVETNQAHAKGRKIVSHTEKDLKQVKGESYEQYIKRLDSMVKRAKFEADVQTRFDVNIVSKEDGIKVEKSTDSFESMQLKRRKTEKERERRMLKRGEKELEEELVTDGFEHLRDDVGFGEVVHRPPDVAKIQLNRYQQVPTADKNKVQKVHSSKEMTGPLDRTVKRRFLPEDERAALEAEQQRAIQLYRTQKARRTKAPLIVI